MGGAQNESKEEATQAAAHGKATASVIGIKAMGTRFNALMTIQIPLQQKRARFGANYPFGSSGVSCFGSNAQPTAITGPAPAPTAFGSAPVAPAFGSAPVAAHGGSFGFSTAASPALAPLGTARAARVSRGGEVLGDFIIAKNKKPKRDSGQHITVTIVLYNTVVGGVPSGLDVKAAIDDMEKLYSACSWSGNLADNEAAFMKSKLTSATAADIAEKIAPQPSTGTRLVQNNAVFPTSTPVSVFKQPTAESVDDLINKSIPKLSKASQLVASLGSGASSKEAESLLTECFHSFRLANDKCLETEGAPSALALYNMACVLSLALELQMIVSGSHSLQAMVDSFGSVAVSMLQSNFVAPGLPPHPLPSTATLQDTINKRAIACDRCLKAAVAVGYNDFNHLRADRDLRSYLASMDTTWFPSS